MAEDPNSFSSSHQTNEKESTTVSVTETKAPDRLDYLVSALNKTVDKCISSAKLQKWASCYRDAYKKNPKMVKAVHKEFMEQLKTVITSEIDVMIKEEQLETLFADFTHVCIPVGPKGTQAWRPSGVPSKDMHAHLVQLKLKQRQKLQSLLQETQTENRKLEVRLAQSRKHLLATQERIDVKKQEMKMCIESVPTKEISGYLTSISPKYQ